MRYLLRRLLLPASTWFLCGKRLCILDCIMQESFRVVTFGVDLFILEAHELFCLQLLL